MRQCRKGRRSSSVCQSADVGDIEINRFFIATHGKGDWLTASFQPTDGNPVGTLGSVSFA
jgi:hypothetical protein